MSKVSKSSYSVQFSVFLIDYGVILSFILSSLATASTADLGNVNTVIFDGESEIFSEKVHLGKRSFGFYKRCTGSLLKSLCSLKVISQPPYWFFFLSICLQVVTRNLNEQPNEHPNEHPSENLDHLRLYSICLLLLVMNRKPNVPNEQPNEHPRENLENHLRLLSICSFYLTRKPNEHRRNNVHHYPGLHSRRSNQAFKKDEMSLKVIKSVIDVRILLKCGDVEVNPGPLFQHNDNLRVADGINDDQLNDERIVEGGERLASAGKKLKSKCDLQVMTLNVRGLSDTKKVRHIVNQCYKLAGEAKNNVFLLQETFVLRLDILKYLWRGEYHLTAGTGNSKGCLTLVTSPYKIVHSSDIDNRGHVLVLTKDSLNRAEVIIVNVYAPNGFDDAKLQFFEDVIEKVSETMLSYNCNNVILAGDLNTNFCEGEVKNRIISVAEKRIAESLKDMLTQLNLEDGWDKVPEKLFTWTSNRTGTPTFSTLDRIIYTKDSFKLLTKTTDWALSLSDHAAVMARFELKAGRLNNTSQICRLDPRLLSDPDGCVYLDNKFGELFGQAAPEWNPHVRLEYLKMCIRTAVNEANGKIKAKFRDCEHDLNRDINEIVGELATDGLMPGRKELLMHKLDDLRQLKRSLVEKIGTKLEQKTARKWYNEGELSNKYFFNLLNRKVNDEIMNILDDDGTEITETELIENRIKTFYKDLYESVPASLDETDELFRHVPEVAPEEAARMSEALTLEELYATLKTCADSAPGPDGLT